MAGYHASIVERLQHAKRHWKAIAKLAGVPYQTLTKIAQGHTASPRIMTLDMLEAGLKRFEQLHRDAKEFERAWIEQALTAAEKTTAKPARKARAAGPEETAA